MIDRTTVQLGLVRIHQPRGGIAGTGFLLSPTIIGTCAHVVADALGLDRTTRYPPPDHLIVDLPFVDRQLRPATVSAWQPLTSLAGGGDIALLELQTPLANAQPVRMLHTEPLAGRSFTACGHPNDHTVGLWASGTIGQAVANGWVQVAIDQIAPGFSGAPVWDQRGQGVIGMLVAMSAQSNSTTTIGWLVPLTQIIALAPALATYREPPADQVSTNTITDLLVSEGQFQPLKQLAITPTTTELVNGFDFVGIHRSTLFAFSVGLLRVSNADPAYLEQRCAQFAQLNDHLFRQPAELDVNWLFGTFFFTLAGVLCLVFEQGGAASYATYASSQQRPSPAFEQGLGGHLWVQDRATSLVWLVDLPDQRLIKHLGKIPDRTNLHAHWTLQELAQLETLLRHAWAQNQSGMHIRHRR